MKQSHAVVLATTLAVSAAFAASASASSSKLAAHAAGPNRSVLSLRGEGDDGGPLRGGGIAHGSIGSAPPSANAASHIRTLGGDDRSGSDGSGALPGGGVAHGSIGSAPPGANAANRIRALGADDGGSDT